MTPWIWPINLVETCWTSNYKQNGVLCKNLFLIQRYYNRTFPFPLTVRCWPRCTAWTCNSSHSAGLGALYGRQRFYGCYKLRNGSIWSLNPRAFEGLIVHHVNGINKKSIYMNRRCKQNEKGHSIITSHHNWSRTRGVSHKYCNMLYNYNLTFRWRCIVIYPYNKTN